MSWSVVQAEVINALPQWALGAAITTVLWFLLLGVWRLIEARLVRRIEAPGEHHVSTVALGVVRATSPTLLFLLAVYAGLQALTLPEVAIEWLGRAALFLVLLQLGMWGSALITAWLEDYEATHLERDAAAVTTMRAGSFVLRIMLLGLLVILALDNIPGIEVTTLLASLGIGGIAVALALQNILSDLFASLSIALDKPLVIGDFVMFGDSMGVVKHIGLKTTRLQSLHGEQIVIGNNDLLNRVILNYSRVQEWRTAFRIGVTYETPHEKLVRIPAMLQEIVESQEHVRFDRAHFLEYGEFSLLYEVVYFVTVPNFRLSLDTRQAINLAIFARFRQEGIQFAYPTRKLLVEGRDGGDAMAQR